MTADSSLERVPRLEASIGGALGRALSAVTDRWLLVAPQANPAMLEMFADRDIAPYRNLMPWAGEFPGKYLTGAVQVLRATGDVRLREALAAFVARLVALQDSDGYLGPWPAGSRLTGRAPNAAGGGGTWDAWGHYHVMLGLLLWHAETGDEAALAAAARMGDLLCDTFLGRTPRLVDTGATEMNLAPVHTLALLHAQTGVRRYLDLALQIVDEFAAEGPDGPLAGDYLRQPLAGKEFFQTPKPRWESLHPIMGLAELYRITGEPAYRQAFERIWWSIVRYDRHNNGGFSSGEQATGNPYHPGAIETCCTIAWIAMSVEMLRLTGNPVVADEIELSTLNSVLGMHSPSGRWATYNTPSDGARFASAHHIVFQARAGSPELNCCSVNSPRGLGMVSDWAVMRGSDGIVLNYYGPSAFRVPLDDGPVVELTQETDYPSSGRIALHVARSQPARFTLRLRIPYWSRRTTVVAGGEAVGPVTPGTYLALDRTWSTDETVFIDFDMAPHFWQGDNECRGLTSLYRGPVLLAYDQRYNRARHAGAAPVVFGADPGQTSGAELQLPAIDAQTLCLQPVTWDDWLPPALLYEVPAVDGTTVRLCDFASAGQTGTLYRSWLRVDHAPSRPPFSPAHPLPSRPL